jgi:serine/threonine protein kinase
VSSDASGSVPASPPAPRSTGSAQTGPDPLIGRVINDRYRIVAMIARGGMGKVYRAEQAPLGREVALKVLNPNYSGDTDPEFHKRFFLEASTTAKLTHPNTVSIFDYGRTDDDVYYIAMELLEGKTLHRSLRETGPTTPERVLHVARQICRSLREAHSLGVIHRDLKPANVYLVRHGDESDFVKVLDFGLVKNLEDKGEDLTQTGLFMGSPKYMSPEQIRGERVDGRADIYALGVIMYEMLTGKVPFDRPNSVNILMAHVHEAPPPMREINPNVQVSPLLEQIVMKTMAKKVEDRFASMEELLVALKQVSTDAGLALSVSRETIDLGVLPGATGQYSTLVSGEMMTQSSSSGARISMTPQGNDHSLIETQIEDPLSLDGAPRQRAIPLAIAGISLLVLLVVAILAITQREGGAGGGRVQTPLTTLPTTPIDLGTTTPGTDTTGTETEVDPTTTAGVATGTTTPDTTTTDSTDPPVVSTIVSLRSRPAGAMVLVRNAEGIQREYGPTPVDIEWTGDNARRGREVTFRFELPGHSDFSVLRTITGSTLEVTAELEALAAERQFRPRPPRRPEGEAPGTPVGPVKGYKLDPY